MRSFKIGEKVVEIDETKEYFDFYSVSEGHAVVVRFDFLKLLTSLELGETLLSDAKSELELLKRWVVDAPRKKFNRDMRKSGATVITDDELFEEDGGEQIIENLANTGKLAQQLLEVLYDQKG